MHNTYSVWKKLSGFADCMAWNIQKGMTTRQEKESRLRKAKRTNRDRPAGYQNSGDGICQAATNPGFRVGGMCVADPSWGSFGGVPGLIATRLLTARRVFLVAATKSLAAHLACANVRIEQYVPSINIDHGLYTCVSSSAAACSHSRHYTMCLHDRRLPSDNCRLQ